MNEKIDPLSYLPEYYQNHSNSFTSRYLSIFTNIYQNFEEQIDESDLLYSPESCPEEFIPWLSSWTALENMELFPNDKKRSLLKLSPFLHNNRGTLDALRAVLALYCDADPFIVEGYHVSRYFANHPILQKLYRGGDFTLWILFPESGERVEALNEIANTYAPAFTKVRVKPLRKVAELDNYSYLDVNAVISKLDYAVLDGRCAMHYTFIGR